MVPVELLAAEEHHSEQGEDHQGDYLLENFELHEGERASVAHEAHSVGRHLEGVFGEGNSPREDDYEPQGLVGADARSLELEVPIPGESHENIGDDEHPDSDKSIDPHIAINFTCLIIHLEKRLICQYR